MIKRTYGKHFVSSGGALTLDVAAVSETGNVTSGQVCTRKHMDGWKITGVIHEDYYEWVNEFSAVHPKYGRVWGNFENEVRATSVKAFNHFYARHPPFAWDYGDI